MTDKPTVVEALSAVMEEVRAVRKGDRNQQQNYSFRGVDAVVNAVGPVLRKHGVVVVPAQSQATYRDVQTSTGKPSRECTVTVTYRFYGPAGDFIDAMVPGESMDFGDKGAPKAMSVAYRIALLQALCIPTDDVEPDAQTYEREREPERERVTDFMWLEDIRRRLVTCGSVAEVRGLWAEAVQVSAEYRLTTDDAALLKQDMDARAKELKGEPVGASA